MLTAYPCVARRAHACYQRHTILIPVAAVIGLESVAQQVACATTSLQQAWLSADTSLLGYGTEERQIAPGPGGTPTIQVDPMTPPSPEARRPVVLVAAAASVTATSDGRVDGRMGLAAAAPVVCSSTHVGSQPLGNRPLVLPSNPKRGANGPLAQEQAAALVQAAAIRAAQAASTSYDQPPSKRPMYKARGMAPRGLTQSTGPVYASCRETRACASSTPLSLPSSLRVIPICLMCIAVRNAPILRRSAGMLNMLKPVQPIPAAMVISETVVVSTTDTRSDTLTSEPGPIVAAFADPEHDMNIVCVTATPAALEVTREGPNELWVKLTLTVCHEVCKALGMDCPS